MKQTYFPNFDWIRLALAAQVVAIHSGASQSVFISPVPAFLAVSGFVVLGSIERRSIGEFFVNRALRVLPLLAASFLVVGYLYGIDEMWHTIRFWIWPFGAPPINPVVWSLVYEELYYIILALLFAAGCYRWKLFPLVPATFFIAAVSRDQFWILPSPLFLLGGAFFLGNLAYLHRDYLRLVPSWFALVFLVGMLIWVHADPYEQVVRPAYAAQDYLSFLAILIFAVAGPQLPKLKVDLSYSLYLFHCIVKKELIPYIPLGQTLFWSMLLCTLPISYACWYLIERPALRMKSKFVPKRPQTAAATE